jgi:hypothetical protein
MGDIGHGLCRCPWQSAAGSGAMRVLATLWPTFGMLGLFYFPEEGEFCCFFVPMLVKLMFPQ